MGPLTPYIMYIKIGAAILVIALSFGAGYRLKTMQVAEKENELLKGDGKGIGFYFRCCHNGNGGVTT